MVHRLPRQWGSQYRRLHPALPSLWEQAQESQYWSSRSRRLRPREGSTAIASKASVDSCTVCVSNKEWPAIHSCVSALVAKMVSQNKLIWPESSNLRKWRALWGVDATVRRITAWRTTASVKQQDWCVIRLSVHVCAATTTRQDHPNNNLRALPASNHKSREIHLSTVKRCMLESPLKSLKSTKETNSAHHKELYAYKIQSYQVSLPSHRGKDEESSPKRQ